MLRWMRSQISHEVLETNLDCMTVVHILMGITLSALSLAICCLVHFSNFVLERIVSCHTRRGVERPPRRARFSQQSAQIHNTIQQDGPLSLKYHPHNRNPESREKRHCHHSILINLP